MRICIHLIRMSTEHGIEKAVLPYLVKIVWQTCYEKQTQKIHLHAALFMPTHHDTTMIGFWCHFLGLRRQYFSWPS